MTVDNRGSELSMSDALIPMDPASDPDTTSLTRYLREKIKDIGGTIDYFRFTGGHANQTYLVKTENLEFVLKREPAGAKAKSAHDMRREFHILSGLGSKYPLAPKPILLCDDDSIFGGVFCLMERIEGEIVRQPVSHATSTSGFAVMARRFFELIEALAKLHRIDLNSTALSNFGRPAGYRVRQVRGWCRRFQDAGAGESDPADDVIAWLLSNIPSSPQQSTIIHNDFKMDNLVWAKHAPDELIGVLDWEMATVGDPLMDLACTLSFWVEENDPAPLRSLRAMPSDDPHLPTRQQALQRYTQLTDTAVDNFDFYRCFGLFRRAAIEQQKYYRFMTGQTKDERYADLDEAVCILLESCRKLI